MAEAYDYNNLPDKHELFTGVKFATVIEGTWTKDGKVNPKWDFVTEGDDNGFSDSFSVFSKTVKENIDELKGQRLDVIAKVNPYGKTIQAFAKAGEPIQKREPKSFRDKQIGQNNKHVALQAAATWVYNGQGAKFAMPEDIIEVAEIFEAWLDGTYKPVEKDTDVKPDKKDTSDRSDG